jgi:lipopolysaccharide/colanic/teichoic acid biosynthesis glycosyltransferase
VALGVVPQQLAEIGPLYPLDQLRMRSLTQGIPCRDSVVRGRLLDLLDTRDLLALNASAVRREVAALPPSEEYLLRGADVLIGRGARVSPSARLVGPLVIQPEAVVEAGAVVVGPAVVGRSARVGNGSLVVRSVVPANGAVASGAKLVRAVGATAAAGKDRIPTSRTGRSHRLDEVMSVETEHGLRVPALQAGRWVLVCKRALDLAGSLVGCAAMLLLLPLIAILIKLDSRGPVFFCHRREGRGGREFPCIKFRTMTADAHDRQRELDAVNEVDGPHVKVADDFRVTRVGRWLRCLNIDELPQLFNVLVGHMSLVGPRPSPFRENQICVPWRESRLSVRPGITGLWQLCRRRGRGEDFSEWIYYDVKYVRHLSVWLDVKILYYTVVSLGGWRPVAASRLLPGEE